MILHATLIAHYADGAWRGVLLRGPSGSGKSDLALRCLARGFRLAADDRVVVWRSGERVYGCAPPALKGLIEVRGVGVVPAPACTDLAPLDLVVDLQPCAASIERLPDPAHVNLASLELPLLKIAAFEAGAPDKIIAALAAMRRRL